MSEELQRAVDEFWARIGDHKATGDVRREALGHMRRVRAEYESCPLPTGYNYDVEMFLRQLSALEQGLPRGDDLVRGGVAPADPKDLREAQDADDPDGAKEQEARQEALDEQAEREAAARDEADERDRQSAQDEAEREHHEQIDAEEEDREAEDMERGL